MKSLNIRWSGAVAALAIAFGSGIVIANNTASAQGSNQRKPFFQPQQQQGNNRNQNPNQKMAAQRRGYASGIAIATDIQYVFVAEGGWVYKLNKSDLSLAANGALRPSRVAPATRGPQGQVVPPTPPPAPAEDPAPAPSDTPPAEPSQMEPAPPAG